MVKFEMRCRQCEGGLNMYLLVEGPNEDPRGCTEVDV